MTWAIILFILGIALGREYANMKFRNRNQIIFYRLSKSAKSEVVKIINEMDDLFRKTRQSRRKKYEKL
ncbi:hypothetical protein [Enterococcus hermanniensis]|uniref:hypothetical protein n=1 Tax=Enterococcus hermanniensis TaxID=249189 RepID=UPI0009001A6A|nr:hypothetical protein [Enterococcus hermanniensis]